VIVDFGVWVTKGELAGDAHDKRQSRAHFLLAVNQGSYLRSGSIIKEVTMIGRSSEIVCTLAEPELQARKAELRQNLKPFLKRSEYADGASVLFFSKPGVTRQQIERMMELERDCCPFFEFELAETGHAFQLSVRGPVGSEGLVRDFFGEPDGAGCGCVRAKGPSARKTGAYIAGFASLCVIACAAPPLLAALGLVGVATGAAWFGWVEAVLIAVALIGLGMFAVQYVKKRRCEAQA